MLRWAVIFIVIAIIAAILGFGGIAAGAASIAKVLFWIFLVLFVLTLIFGGKVFSWWLIYQFLYDNTTKFYGTKYPVSNQYRIFFCFHFNSSLKQKKPRLQKTGIYKTICRIDYSLNFSSTFHHTFFQLIWNNFYSKKTISAEVE